MSATIAPPSSRPPWVEVTELGDERLRVRLGGPFGPTWMASLCTGLCDHDLSVELAHAMRSHDFAWMAELTVQADEGAEDLRELPYLEWAGSAVEPRTSRLRLNDFDLVETPAHGGTLCLTLEADDVLGLLGSLLSQLAGLQLFAIEMHIETRAGRAYDRFWLATVAGAPPTEALRRDLERLLAEARR